jgi:hypothetical protein
VNEIDRVNMYGQVVERDFVSAPTVVAPQIIPSPMTVVGGVSEVDRVNAFGQVVERDFVSVPTVVAPQVVPSAAMVGGVAEVDTLNAYGQVIEHDFIGVPSVIAGYPSTGVEYVMPGAAVEYVAPTNMVECFTAPSVDDVLLGEEAMSLAASSVEYIRRPASMVEYVTAPAVEYVSPALVAEYITRDGVQYIGEAATLGREYVIAPPIMTTEYVRPPTIVSGPAKYRKPVDLEFASSNSLPRAAPTFPAPPQPAVAIVGPTAVRPARVLGGGIGG